MVYLMTSPLSQDIAEFISTVHFKEVDQHNRPLTKILNKPNEETDELQQD